MKSRIVVAVLFTAAAGAGAGIPLAISKGDVAASAQARVVADRFFRTIDERRYAQTCDLLSARFYNRNHVPDKRHCVLGLSVGMAMAPSYRFEITAVRVTRNGAVVSATANGQPGRVVLVLERGVLKVLAVQGA